MTKQDFLDRAKGSLLESFVTPIINNEPIWAILNVPSDVYVYAFNDDRWEDTIHTMEIEMLSKLLSSGDINDMYETIYLCEKEINLKNEEQPVFEKLELKLFLNRIANADVISVNYIHPTNQFNSIVDHINFMDDKEEKSFVYAILDHEFEVKLIDRNDLEPETISKYSSIYVTNGKIDMSQPISEKNTIIQAEQTPMPEELRNHQSKGRLIRDSKTVWDLKMHETMILCNQEQWTDMLATRVPGGWLYKPTGKGKSNVTSVFVPYVDQIHNEGCTLCGNVQSEQAELIMEVLNHLNDMQSSIDVDGEGVLLSYINEYLKTR